jgi:pimeloyl-ACP methyl ester carboxylesterase
MPYTKSENISIYYDDIGAGEPALLLMPGWCDSRTEFHTFREECSKHRRTIIIDWRGHGKSEATNNDFGFNELVKDALSVIEATGVNNIIPVSITNSGWVAIELLQKLGSRIPKLIFKDWLVLQPPFLYIDMLHSLQDPKRWESTRDRLFQTWLDGVYNPDAIKLVREIMAAHDFEMWSRATREIISIYKKFESPLKLLDSFESHIPVLHVYSQPNESGYLESQETFAESHDWFNVIKLITPSHFFTLEKPKESAALMEKFIRGASLDSYRTAI